MKTLPGFKAVVATAMITIAGSASAAVALGENGLGQGLLFPYYTVNGGHSTTIAVQNTTADAKALKVRISESFAGRDAQNLNVYLAPYATWTAAVVARVTPQGEDSAVLQLTAGTCVAPWNQLVAVPFSDIAFTDRNQDGGGSSVARVRQGQIEVIEMGTLESSLVPLVSEPSPPNCAAIYTRWTDGGIWRQQGFANQNLLAPSGGLRGDAIVINVPSGTAFGYQALGVTGLATAPRHTPPFDSHPRLYEVQTAAGADIPVALIDGDGNLEQLSYPADRGKDAISALLTYASVSSSYNVAPQLAARTDWLLTFPTRFAFVDDAPGGVLPPQTFPIAPFTSRLCEEGTLTRYDAIGRKQPSAASSSVDLCTQFKTLRFRHSSTDAPLVAGVDGQLIPVDVSGTAVLDVATVDGDPRRSRPDNSGRCLRGLPMWLLAVTAYDNTEAQPGRVATYPEARVGSGKRVIEDC